MGRSHRLLRQFGASRPLCFLPQLYSGSKFYARVIVGSVALRPLGLLWEDPGGGGIAGTSVAPSFMSFCPS